MPEKAIAFMKQHRGESLFEASPDLYRRGIEQVNAAIRILESRGVSVHQAKALEPGEEAYLDYLVDGFVQHFVRDPIIIIGHNIIETELYLPLRRKERFGIRRALKERLEQSNARLVSLPPAIPVGEDGNWGPGPFLEGGDVFLLGRDIYVGNSGNASNAAGITWLRRFLGADYRVHEVPLSKRFLHLDCVLATPRPGLALVCQAGFLQGLPEFLRDWELIEVSAEDAETKLACNGLVLDEKTILVAEELPHLAEALTKAGQEVLTTPFDAVYLWGGAFRCWHHPLVRESKLD
jgi:glycine amidinotransferase